MKKATPSGHDMRPASVRIFRAAVGLAVTIAAIWLISLVPYEMLREERARAFGEIRTTGQVVSKKIQEDDGEPLYLIKYKYFDLDGLRRTGMANMPQRWWKQFRRGSAVTVYFARSRPTLSRIRHMVEPKSQVWLRNWLRDDAPR